MWTSALSILQIDVFQGKAISYKILHPLKYMTTQKWKKHNLSCWHGGVEGSFWTGICVFIIWRVRLTLCFLKKHMQHYCFPVLFCCFILEFSFGWCCRIRFLSLKVHKCSSKHYLDSNWLMNNVWQNIQMCSKAKVSIVEILEECILILRFIPEQLAVGHAPAMAFLGDIFAVPYALMSSHFDYFSMGSIRWAFLLLFVVLSWFALFFQVSCHNC